MSKTKEMTIERFVNGENVFDFMVWRARGGKDAARPVKKANPHIPKYLSHTHTILSL